jgi:hypothetical protein
MLWFISIKLNILGTLKFNMQVHVVIPQIFFVFQILCKYSLGLFLLTMHSRKGWHLDRTEGPAIIASLITKKIFCLSDRRMSNLYHFVSVICTLITFLSSPKPMGQFDHIILIPNQPVWSFSLMLNASRRSNKYQLYSLWFGRTKILVK